MRVVDEFVTVFRAVDQFSGQVDRMARSMERFKDRFESVQAMLGAAGAGLSLSPAAAISALAGVKPHLMAVGAVVFAITAALAGSMVVWGGSARLLLRLGQAAVPVAAELQQLEAVFAALTGSADTARKRMEYLVRFAETSVFEFPDLVRVATQLEAFGLNIERLLPLIAQMGAVFGANREHLMMLASAFGRMAAGQFGEAMEIFRAFGISAGDLMAEGIRVSASGEIQSSVREVFAALERIIQARFGRVAAIMGGTLAVQLSNLRDSVTRLLADIGRALLPTVQQFVGSIQRALQFLQQTRLGQFLGERVTQILQNARVTELALRAIFTAVAVIEALPNIVQAGIDIFTRFFTFLSKILNAIVTILNKIFRTNLSVEERVFGQDLGWIIKRIRKRQEELFQLFQAFQPATAVGAITPQGDYFTRQINELQKIEQNTREVAQHTRELVDLQRIALGGGELGRRGISAVTRARGLRYQSRPASQELEQLVGLLLQRLRRVGVGV